jgi:hypothetical protein
MAKREAIDRAIAALEAKYPPINKRKQFKPSYYYSGKSMKKEISIEELTNLKVSIQELLNDDSLWVVQVISEDDNYKARKFYDIRDSLQKIYELIEVLHESK